MLLWFHDQSEPKVSEPTRKSEVIVNQPKVQEKILVEAQYPVAIFCMGIGDHLVTLPAVRALASRLMGDCH